MQKTLSVINLSAIRHNARLVRSMIGDRFFYAVVKADGYGHGAVEGANALRDLVDCFCVSLEDEGAALRVGGVYKPVLVLTPPLDMADAEKMAFYGLTPTVGNMQSAHLVKGQNCHIAINTGMNRYGCNSQELKAVLNVLPAGSVKGVFTHLYAAHNAQHSGRQLRAFKNEAAVIACHSPDALCHVSASGGILRGDDYLLDGVRCGLMLYGYAPYGFRKVGLEKALKVYARLAQSTQAVGGGIGYNIADKRYSRLHTYRLGYADGFSRGVPLGEKTLCMDAFISKDEKELLPVMTDAEAYAERCGTIPYEVLCSVTRRSERVYVR